MFIANLIAKTIDKFYREPLSLFLPQQVFRYLACGALTATLDTIWYYLIYHYISSKQAEYFDKVIISPHIAALCVVFPITFFTGFWLNRNVAFQVTDVSSRPQLIKYALTVVGSIILNYVCMKLFVDVFGIWATPSKMLTTAVCAIYSFMAGRYFTFKR